MKSSVRGGKKFHYSFIKSLHLDLIEVWFTEDPLEKEMATHSSLLPWKIPWTEEPGSLQSMGLQRVRHD